MKKKLFHRRKLALKPGYMFFRKSRIERVPGRIIDIETTGPWPFPCRACGQEGTTYRVTIILDSHPDKPQLPHICDACAEKARSILEKGSKE